MTDILFGARFFVFVGPSDCFSLSWLSPIIIDIRQSFYYDLRFVGLHDKHSGIVVVPYWFEQKVGGFPSRLRMWARVIRSFPDGWDHPRRNPEVRVTRSRNPSMVEENYGILVCQSNASIHPKCRSVVFGKQGVGSCAEHLVAQPFCWAAGVSRARHEEVFTK